MDIRIPTITTLKVSRRDPLESTIQCLKYLDEMEICAPLLVKEPDMYSFIYNINRVRRKHLPEQFLHLSDRKYITVKLIDLDSLLIIRVK